MNDPSKTMDDSPIESNQPNPPESVSNQSDTSRDLNQAGARDILVFRGAEYWPTPEDVIREVHAQGLSVRIPRNHIPEGLVHGLSRIALGHIKAVMTIEHGTEDDLRAAFEALIDPESQSEKPGKEPDPRIAEVLARTYEHAPSRWLEMPDSADKRAIFERLGVKFSPGIFAYSYYTGLTYYLKPEETEAPADLAAKGIQAVRGVIAETGEVIPVAESSCAANADDDDDES
ncbi:hypothetical protein ANRL3_00860 [Anaerolineae bacterium]|nr:hypothetical protein ANRL3_00860 [Anaerolineae bacterium]